MGPDQCPSTRHSLRGPGAAPCCLGQNTVMAYSRSIDSRYGGVGERYVDKLRHPMLPCGTCGLEFASETDLRVHRFRGHRLQRPELVLDGRDCGYGRLTITNETSPADWVIRNADAISINGRATTIASAVQLLSTQRSGVVEVTLTNADGSRSHQFEFVLADIPDLDGVDAALGRLIRGGELSLRAIDDFIVRSKRYPTATRYLSGLADYLYGVLAREGAAESGLLDASIEGGGYEGKYDRAVSILGSFDREPAEAICGIVAFHYNQFERAMTKTKSNRVADVSMRFQAMLSGAPWSTLDLTGAPHSSLDLALSDSVVDQVLAWSALPLNGTATSDVAEMVANIETQRPYDAFKLHLVAAEHSLASGDVAAGATHAEHLRHSRSAEDWYSDFRQRLQGSFEPVTTDAGSHKALLETDPVGPPPGPPETGEHPSSKSVRQKKDRPTTILALVEYAYGEAGRKLTLARKDLREAERRR